MPRTLINNTSSFVGSNVSVFFKWYEQKVTIRSKVQRHSFHSLRMQLSSSWQPTRVLVYCGYCIDWVKLELKGGNLRHVLVAFSSL